MPSDGQPAQLSSPHRERPGPAALISALLAFPHGCGFLGPRSSRTTWSPEIARRMDAFVIAIVLCLIPAGFAWWLARALSRTRPFAMAQNRCPACALATAALPTGLLQMLLFSVSGAERSLAPVIGLFLMPLLFGMGLWFAVRQYQTATGHSAGPWPRRFVSIFAVLYLVTLPSLCTRTSYTPHRSRASAVPSAKGQLSQGAIDLVAVAPHPSVNQSWWNADGTPSAEGPFVNDGSRVNPQGEERGYEFVFRPGI